VTTQEKLDLATTTLQYYSQVFGQLWWPYELPFEWTNSKVWALDLPVKDMGISNFL